MHSYTMHLLAEELQRDRLREAEESRRWREASARTVGGQPPRVPRTHGWRQLLAPVLRLGRIGGGA